jgi:hypothetical protein
MPNSRLWLRLLTIALTVAVAAACAAQTTAPIAHWKMDALTDGKVADVTGNGHDALLGPDGATLQEVASPCGKGLVFDGKQQGAYLQVEKSTDLDSSPQFTVMAWIKPAERSKAYEILCGKGDKYGDPPWPGWRFRYSWARISFELGTTANGHVRISTPQHTVPPGFFSHVAATWDGHNARLYVNCILMAELEHEGDDSLLPGKRPYIIGNYIGRKDAYPFDGALDELKVFDHALDAVGIFTEATRDMP